jgi:energy-converting hydrogenase Eha subunit F
MPAYTLNMRDATKRLTQCEQETKSDPKIDIPQCQIHSPVVEAEFDRWSCDLWRLTQMAPTTNPTAQMSAMAAAAMSQRGKVSLETALDSRTTFTVVVVTPGRTPVGGDVVPKGKSVVPGFTPVVGVLAPVVAPVCVWLRSNT